MQAEPTAGEILVEREVVAVEVLRPGAEIVRPGWVRPVAVALVIYGAIGLVLTLVLIVVGVAIWPQLQAVSGQLGSSLHSTSVTVGSAATAMGGVEASLNQVQQVTDSASKTALQASTDTRQLAQAMNFQVLGTQPLAALLPSFNSTADNLQQVGTSLAGTSQAVAQNSAQAAALQSNLTTTQQELEQLSQAFNSGLGGVGLPLLLLVVGTWVMLLLQSALALIAGIALLQR
jgi:hypothetical protein